MPGRSQRAAEALLHFIALILIQQHAHREPHRSAWLGTTVLVEVHSHAITSLGQSPSRLLAQRVVLGPVAFLVVGVQNRSQRRRRPFSRRARRPVVADALTRSLRLYGFVHIEIDVRVVRVPGQSHQNIRGRYVRLHLPRLRLAVARPRRDLVLPGIQDQILRLEVPSLVDCSRLREGSLPSPRLSVDHHLSQIHFFHTS